MKSFLRSFSSLLLIHSRRVVVSYKRMYVHELLVNPLFKPAQEKVWLVELTIPLNMLTLTLTLTLSMNMIVRYFCKFSDEISLWLWTFLQVRTQV